MQVCMTLGTHRPVCWQVVMLLIIVNRWSLQEYVMESPIVKVELVNGVAIESGGTNGGVEQTKAFGTKKKKNYSFW